MTQASMPFVDLAVARLLEACHTWRGVQYARAQAKIQPASNSEILAVGGGYAVYAGPGSPLNKASGLGLQRAVTPDVLDQTEQFYHSHLVPARVELCPLADTSLLILLRERGYRLESFLNMMVRTVPDNFLPVDLAPDTLIAQATPEQAGVWIRTTTQGFEGVGTPSDVGLAIQAPTFHSENCRCYLAWVGGQPAAGAAMLVHERVTEFGGTSTRPAFRRRGLQTALLHTRLNTAREIGCAYAITLTSPGSASQRNVERAGFQLAYTKAFMVNV